MGVPDEALVVQYEAVIVQYEALLVQYEAVMYSMKYWSHNVKHSLYSQYDAVIVCRIICRIKHKLYNMKHWFVQGKAFVNN